MAVDRALLTLAGVLAVGFALILCEYLALRPLGGYSLLIISLELAGVVACSVWVLREARKNIPKIPPVEKGTQMWEDNYRQEPTRLTERDKAGQVFCMYCQYVLPEDAVYCRRCGKQQIVTTPPNDVP
jgi:uncharacterized paraquat-inducible protein A